MPVPKKPGNSMTPILRAAAWLAAALALGAACQAMAAPAGKLSPEEQLGSDPNVAVSYYEVTGTSDKMILRQIAAQGRALDQTKRWAGHTQASFQYGWPTWSNGACDLSRASVTYKVSVVLPRLKPGIKLEGSTARWWAIMTHNLTLHELDHVKLALGYAKAMEAAIRAATCDTARAEAERVMAEFDAANALYDKATEHGTKLPSRSSRQAPAEN
jgi:predicted secreted Zn-dependent protease